MGKGELRDHRCESGVESTMVLLTRSYMQLIMTRTVGKKQTNY